MDADHCVYSVELLVQSDKKRTVLLLLNEGRFTIHLRAAHLNLAQVNTSCAIHLRAAHLNLAQIYSTSAIHLRAAHLNLAQVNISCAIHLRAVALRVADHCSNRQFING